MLSCLRLTQELTIREILRTRMATSKGDERKKNRGDCVGGGTMLDKTSIPVMASNGSTHAAVSYLGTREKLCAGVVFGFSHRERHGAAPRSRCSSNYHHQLLPVSMVCDVPHSASSRHRYYGVANYLNSGPRFLTVHVCVSSR